MLEVEQFDEFFRAIHGVSPFPWQRRLLRSVVERGEWPAVLDIPTGAGKTAAMDIAVFHLAIELNAARERTAPIRIAFVVDRRLIVDDAYERARKIAKALQEAAEGILHDVATCFRDAAGVENDGEPLVVTRLRGGIPQEGDWARTPSQPTILCSTVDQVGSRLLFRGYGVSDSMKPVHAGLLGSDCLILLDEAHLANPFRQTLELIERYRSTSWREETFAAPWGVCHLSATPGEEAARSFQLNDDDLADSTLAQRLSASKPARLILASGSRGADAGPVDAMPRSDDVSSRADVVLREVRSALEHMQLRANIATPAVGVVMNRVARARAVYYRIATEFADADVVLLIGPARPVERESITAQLTPVRTGNSRTLDRPLIVVATQCIEAGVDLDLDALITELAPLDSLRQRFGRLNRAGRPITAYAAIVAWKSDISSRYVDPVYDTVLKPTFEQLTEHTTDAGKDQLVQFGIRAFRVPMDEDVLTRKSNAPVLLPAHVDLLCQTSPLAISVPDIGALLHGPDREGNTVSVAWRADIRTDDDPELVRRLLTLAPPTSGEIISLPAWVIRKWLATRVGDEINALADIPITTPETVTEAPGGRRVFRWRGDVDQSTWVWPNAVAAGDLIVVPSDYGGADKFGWNPQSRMPVVDVGADAARKSSTARFVVRVAPGLVGDVSDNSLAASIAQAPDFRWHNVRDALLRLPLPTTLRDDLLQLGRTSESTVSMHRDVYPADSNGSVRGVVFVASRQAARRQAGRRKLRVASRTEATSSTESDVAGSLTGAAVPLSTHTSEIEEIAALFGEKLRLPPDRLVDIVVAAKLHDAGKADPRFQSWLRAGDPFGFDEADPSTLLAKSARTLPPSARAGSGLPERWRHEALSVRIAMQSVELAGAKDPDLVLWLIGTHHGYGRPLFPHADPLDDTDRSLASVDATTISLRAAAGPQSFSFDWRHSDWPSLARRVRDRYGWWELARYEVILRLADHRASELHTGLDDT